MKNRSWKKSKQSLKSPGIWSFYFCTNPAGYRHPLCSELEKSGIRVGIDHCSVTERRWWSPSYPTCKTVHVHAKHNTYIGNMPIWVCTLGLWPCLTSTTVKKKKKKKKKKTAKQAMQAALTKSILWSSQGLWNSYILKGFL